MDKRHVDASAIVGDLVPARQPDCMRHQRCSATRRKIAVLNIATQAKGRRASGAIAPPGANCANQNLPPALKYPELEGPSVQPMTPMKPMELMSSGSQWWPNGLGWPNSSGSQNGVRYAFFREPRRLAINMDGHIAVYDIGDHDIGGVSQQQNGSHSLAFASPRGDVMVGDLKKV
jgi:hypothetical protein